MNLDLGDSYSGYFELAEVTSTPTTVTINHLKKWFSFLGVPDVLEPDNIPFNSVDLQISENY